MNRLRSSAKPPYIFRFRQSLKAYLNACFQSDLHERAHRSVIWYRSKFRENKKHLQYLDASVFNCLLRGWADIGNLNRFNEVLSMMKSVNMPKDMKIYSRLLLCHFNQSRLDLQAISKILSTMKSSNINVSKILSDPSLSFLQKVKLRDTLIQIDPNIVFERDEYRSAYNCDVLNDFNLANKKYSNLMEGIDTSNMIDWFFEQQENELKSNIIIESVYKNPDTRELKWCRAKWQELNQEWQQTLTEAFNSNLEVMRRSVEETPGMNVYPYLKALDPKVYVKIMLDQISSYALYSQRFSPPTSYLHYGIGCKAASAYLSHLRSRNYSQSSELYVKFIEYFTNPKISSRTSSRDHWLSLANQKGHYLCSELEEIRMPIPVVLYVGKFLHDILMHNLKIDCNLLKPKAHIHMKVPIFYNVHINNHNSVRSEIRSNLVFAKLFRTVGLEKIRFPATLLPMLVPPVPWLTTEMGGFIFNDLDLIKSVSSSEEDALLSLKLAQEADITPVLDALNALSMVPWKINKKVSISGRIYISLAVISKDDEIFT